MPNVPSSDSWASLPKYLSSDHNTLYRFHPRQAHLRVLEVTEIKTVPYVPLSHAFVERRIRTVQREYLDQTLFWTTADLETKLLDGGPDRAIYCYPVEHYQSWRAELPDVPLTWHVR
jgi:MOSC domain-containing protein YiiM